MLSFFRINDPYRLIFVFLLLLIFRLPFILSGIPLIIPELNWMLVGEAMSSGAIMYRDIWDNTGPLSAFTYQVVDFFFGRSQLTYQLLSLFLVFVQAIIFNRLLLINKAFNENSYVPALIYVTCMSSNFEFLTLSPELMSVTFVLLAINNIFKRIDNFTKDELFLNTGLYLGLSTLFHFPSFLFLVSTLLSLILFSNAIPRRLLLMTFGYFQLILIVVIYYYWHDTGREFYYQFFHASFALERSPFLAVNSLSLVLLVPGAFFILSFFKLYSRKYYVNFQVKFQSVMLLTLLMAFVTLFFEPTLSSSNLIYFLPVIVFFLSHFFLLIEKRIKAEIVFVLFLVLNFSYQYIIDKNLQWLGQLVDFTSLEVTHSDFDQLVVDKKILVLGNQLSHYKNASLATPYLNWQLSKIHLQNLDYYDVLTDVFKNFESNLPHVIIDLENVAPKLMEKMPTISVQYEKSGENIYILKGSENAEL